MRDASDNQILLAHKTMMIRNILGLPALLAASTLCCVASAGSLDDVKHVVVFMQENRGKKGRE
jgi:phospholipase C